MPAQVAPATAPSELAWRVIGLVNLYRLLVPPMLLGLRWLSLNTSVSEHVPGLFVASCIVYFFAGILLILARRLSWPSLSSMAIVNALIDSVAISLILYASDGVQSGLGILLVLPVGAMAVLAGSRDAFFIAAIAALSVLAQQILLFITGVAPASDNTTAGVLGAVLFITGLSGWLVANRLRESEALVRRREVDLANLAQLSQYIVQHLRESILVLDTEDRIRLINESAAQMLGEVQAVPGTLLGEASPRLLYLLETWRQSGRSGPDSAHTFVAADAARIIRPHFAPLGKDEPGPVLVFLEDTSVLAAKVQQSKLASLGRLSASIAHEIRNPVGAMSHAAQLLAESSILSHDDKRLTEIIRSNADRVSTIINNVLQLSKREERRLERLPLHAWVEDFHREFCETMQWDPRRLKLSGIDGEIEVSADASQLHQIVWNLCDNACRHASSDGSSEVEIRIGRLSAGGRPFLEVADRGAGVSPEDAERIFEPFYSARSGGTGLGLFLARELAQTNDATLLYDPRPDGGSIFRLVFSDPSRWELREP
jgi:two-component system sensor histidine kinase PilS (NtrC family)